MEISQDHHLAIDQDHHLVTSQEHLAISQAQDHILLETMEKVDQEMDLQTRSHDSKQQGQDQAGRNFKNNVGAIINRLRKKWRLKKHLHFF
jgi:hypothetical protein